MKRVLVTGGTGTLGIPTVGNLMGHGWDVRVLSRRARTVDATGETLSDDPVGRNSASGDLARGDLLSGAGVREALAGVHTVVHLATGRRDLDAARNLMALSSEAGISHFIFMSIVGVDRIPLGYYRQKLAIERQLGESDLPHTVLRATQFHQLVERVFTSQRVSPILWAPRFRVQPIEVSEVAERLCQIVDSDAAGRVPDIGGPESAAASDFAREWSAIAGSTRRVVPIRLPGRTFAAYAAGHNLVGGVPWGQRTFRDYLLGAAEQ